MTACRRIDEARLALMLLTRLPVGRFETPPDMAAARWVYPLAGVPVGLIGWAAFAGGTALGLAPLVAALVALAALALTTGGLHHDGLADFADGMGGRDRARRLEIMRDSRIGSYGVLALVLVLALGAASLAELPVTPRGAAALLLSAVASRLLMLVVLDTLPPARGDGLGQMASGGRGSRAGWLPGGALAVLLCLPLGGAGLAALLVMALTALVLARRAQARLGGQTGDVLGAVQLCSETAGWLVLGALL
ncbi:adenosylcobinamide-GDP ribazoletransferase [Salipiger sp. P9]|uniref:adenosylcobinamide-GDP ribazoletransferase n=1 Tax=Salipiger pentaromativorans TaxID=2943193 RepID=UPI00215890FC|nr:adenosylcobinamide-GDP ribazoletransferase [Salipiger pentaromativorans]